MISVIVGPKDGPIAKTDDINAAFKQIMDEQLTFVSRGDNSGTHNKETGIWEKLGITDYESNPNYVSAGAGMADTLAMADEKVATACLTAVPGLPRRQISRIWILYVKAARNF